MYQSVLSWGAHFLGPVYMHNNTFFKAMLFYVFGLSYTC